MNAIPPLLLLARAAVDAGAAPATSPAPAGHFPWATIGAIGLAAMGSFLFSSLTYSLRDFSRTRLEATLTARGKRRRLDQIVDNTADHVVFTAFLRLLFNILVLIAVLRLFHDTRLSLTVQYTLSVLITLTIGLFCSVVVPHAVARHMPEGIIATFAGLLRVLWIVGRPIARLMDAMDVLVRRVAGVKEQTEEDKIEEEILSVVEEGEEQGVVDEEEREMIESVIEFHDTTAGQIMTARPEIVALDVKSSLPAVKQLLEESGHSRIPVYEGTLDQIVGILYARDLLRFVGQPPEKFDLRSALRAPLYVPETKPVPDLLRDFKLQKIHIAIVLDEYGGTAGLVTIEDVLEELVGEISDEHEPLEAATFRRLDDATAEVDARMYIDELNRLMGLTLPEDQGYDTVGGFVTTTMGRIPAAGETFDHGASRFTVLEAEPHKVGRVKVEIVAAAGEAAPEGK